MTTQTTLMSQRAADSRFFLAASVAFALFAFGAFAPTYWLQLPAGTFVGSTLLHVHAILYSLWVILLIWQASSAARGQRRQHRAWGFAGIALASLMVASGAAVAIAELRSGLMAGYADQSRRFAIIPFSALTLFVGFFAAAMMNVARPAAHQRLMLLATITLLQAAAARIFFFIHRGMEPGLRLGLGPPPPLAVGLIPSLMLEIFVLAGIVYDWRVRGRPHPAWLVGFGLLALEVALRPLLASTPTWLAAADALARIVD